jgi:hypothetical protein
MQCHPNIQGPFRRLGSSQARHCFKLSADLLFRSVTSHIDTASSPWRHLDFGKHHTKSGPALLKDFQLLLCGDANLPRANTPETLKRLL